MGRGGGGGGGGGGVEMEEELQDTQVYIGFTQILFLYKIFMPPPPPLTCLIYTLHIVHFTFKVFSPQHGFPCTVSVCISFFSVHMYSVPVPPPPHTQNCRFSGCEFKVRLHQHSYKVRQTLLTTAVRLPVYLVYRSGLYKLGP